MLDALLVPEQAVEKGGEGSAIEAGEAAGRRFLLTLEVTRAVEQESLEVSVWGSEDGANWPTKLSLFPQKFYPGSSQLLLDLASHPEVKFLRAKWEVNRWGRGDMTPRFTFSLGIKELAG